MHLAYARSFPLEDLSIRSGGDGRTVDAYAAIFDIPAHIVDQDGEYDEVIDPTCFNRAIEHARRSSGGFNIPVMFNHGKTLYGTASELGTMPIGVAEEIKADRRGLFTRSRYNNTPLAEATLENIREGSISAYSFQGYFKRSDQATPRGGFRAGRDGSLVTVRRTESTLREYGPTPFPAYADASVIGMRAEQAATLLANLAPGEIDRLAEMFRADTPVVDPSADGTPDDSGLADQDQPLQRHSARSPLQEARARRAAFIIKYGDMNHG